MMAAAQPFLSGAISKTVNLPETATVEEIADVYLQGWKLGLKALAVYRDNCKVGQPLSDGKSDKTDDKKSVVVETEIVEKVVYRPTRKRLPKSRPSRTTSFSVGGAEGYMTSGSYPDDGLGEVFLKLGKQGSTLAGVMDAFSIAVSIGLQYGVPLETFVQKFTNLKFEPAGLTDDPDIRMAQSIMDYIFRRLALDYLSFDERAELGIYTATERARQVETGSYLAADEVEELSEAESLKNDAGDEVNTDLLDQLDGAGGERQAGAGRGPDHLGAVRVDHRHQRRRAALPDLRHEDAPEWLAATSARAAAAPAAAADPHPHAPHFWSRPLSRWGVTGKVGREPSSGGHCSGNGDWAQAARSLSSTEATHLTHQKPRRPGATSRTGAPCPASSSRPWLRVASHRLPASAIGKVRR